MKKHVWKALLQEFRHKELRSNTCIRLVQIHPELFLGDISCTLRHFETDTPTCPDYAALSYVWGDSSPTHTIYINRRVYRVHQSLWEFLSHIRTKENTERTWIWTDLLCIDQAHHSEKNEQISRMGEIYAQAAYVLSWLGNNEKTMVALRIILDMSEGFDIGSAPKYAWRSSESEQIHKACDQLGFEEPYWERVWVLQEVACAKTCIVVCSDISVDFGDLLHRMDVAMKRSVRFNDFSDRDRRMRRIKALADLKTSIQQEKPIKFLALIEKTSFCKATRDHDRVYGLLGLANRLDPGFDSRALQVSQHKSLTDVWWDIIFMISDGDSNDSIKSDLAALQNLKERLAPPRKHWEPEMESGIRTAIRRHHAETASLVSKAAYSASIQEFLGMFHYHKEHNATIACRQDLQEAWDTMTTHVYNHEHDVSGLQTRLGWSTYAGLRFNTWHVENRSPETPVNILPLGWLCAAHMPDSPSKATAKHPIVRAYAIKAPPEGLYHQTYCSGAGFSEDRCNLSEVVLRIERLSVTCLVRSADRVQIDFYCDCCDPSTASAELPRNVSWTPENSVLSAMIAKGVRKDIAARIREVMGDWERGEPLGMILRKEREIWNDLLLSHRSER